MSEAANYIVFHPDRARLRVRVRATALVGNRLEPGWSGTVWVDAPPGNEDPFVLGPSWAYSYCHATQLRREPQRASYVSRGSRLLFVSGDIADKESVLAVDTIFVVAESHRWDSERQQPKRYEQDVSGRSALWEYHLRFGGEPNGHKGRFTFEAARYGTESSDYSRLPLTSAGDRASVPFSRLEANVARRIDQSRYLKRPVLLTNAEVDGLLGRLRANTAIEIVGDIEPTDVEFEKRRQLNRGPGSDDRCGAPPPRRPGGRNSECA